MANANKPDPKPDRPDPKPKLNFYFVDNVKYETDQEELSGAQIKAKVADWPASYGLLLDGHADEDDRLIADDEMVPLAKDHGPQRFTRVPPATYGA